MLSGHAKNHESLQRLVAENPDPELDETISRNFLRDIRAHLPYLEYIKAASATMQGHLTTLEECQAMNDLIVELKAEGCLIPGHDFERCK